MTEKQKQALEWVKKYYKKGSIRHVADLADDQTAQIESLKSELVLVKAERDAALTKQTPKPIAPEANGMPSCQSCGKQYPNGTKSVYCNLCGQRLKV